MLSQTHNAGVDFRNLSFERLPAAVSSILEQLEILKDLLLNREIQSSKPEVDKLLSINEAAAYLNLSKATLYPKVSKRMIPHMKRGNKLYFSQQELTEWVKAGRKQSAVEIDAKAESFLSLKNKGSVIL